MKTAVCYCRKSITVKGMTEEESVGYQQQAVQHYADTNGITIVKFYNDIGYTGTNVNRPELQEMLTDLKNKPVDYLLFYSVDRLGRDLINNIETVNEIIKYVDQAYFVTERLSTGNEYFKMLFLLHTGLAEDSRKLLLTRLSDGRRAKVMARKLFNGNCPPLGYVNSSKENRLIPASFEHELEATNGLEAVLFIYYCYLFGMSLRDIATELIKAFGLTRRGKDWSYKSVDYILSNQAYISVLSGRLEKKIHYRIEEANIDPIIDPLLFQFVQQKLQKEKPGRKRFFAPTLPTFAICVDCAYPLTFTNTKCICLHCNKEVNANEIKNALRTQIEALLKSDCGDWPTTKQDIRLNLTEKYRLQSKMVLERIKELEARRRYIEKLNQPDRVGNMIEANTLEMKKARELLKFVEGMLEFLTDFDCIPEKRSIKLNATYLIKLPYVTFVDLNNKEVLVVFHKKVHFEMEG